MTTLQSIKQTISQKEKNQLMFVHGILEEEAENAW